MALDDAQSAKKPQAVDEQDDLFGKFVSTLRNHIFGKGEGGILRALQEAPPENVGQTIGEMVFTMVQEVAHQAEAKGAQPEYDMLIGVATEAIDDIVELAEASGLDVPDEQREFALLYAQQLYVENQNPTDDEREAAKQDLAMLKQDGDVDEATKYVQQRGMEAGADPFDVAGMDGGGGEEKPQRPGLMGEQ